MDSSTGTQTSSISHGRKTGNQNIQVYVRVRPINARERGLRSIEVVDCVSSREIVARNTVDTKITKKFTFDRTFGPNSRQVEVYGTVVAPLIEEVLAGYNCTVFAYGQTGTGKTHTMVGTETAGLRSSWEDDSEVGIIPRALSHLFDELRMMDVEFSMRISYLELYNEELCDLLSTDDSIKIRIFDDAAKKGSVIIQNLEEIPVHSKDDVYKLLEKGQERRRTATTLMNAQSSRSHTVFSILVHIRENGIDGEEMLKIGKLNLVDLAGSENATKAGNEKGIRVRETVNINQSLLTLGRVITALVERTPHIPYRESKLTRLLQESLGGRTKTSIIATVSPGHKDLDETLSTLQYADRAKNIQNKPEVNQRLTKRTVLKEYTEEIDKLKRDLMAARDKNGIYLAEETYNELTSKMDSQNRELNEKMLLLKALKEEMLNKEKIFNEISLNLVSKTAKLEQTQKSLEKTKDSLLETKKVLNKAKRRYKEKKTLLESHVKTEEVLTGQAHQILEVADVATTDTHHLHKTIERRRDVDRQIERTTEQFAERMQDNFEILDGRLQELVKQHQLRVKNIDIEFKSGCETQKNLVTTTARKLNELETFFKDSMSQTLSLEEKYSRFFTDLSTENKSILAEWVNEQKRINLQHKERVEQTLVQLVANKVEQSEIVQGLHTNVIKALEQASNELDTFTMQLRENVSKSLTYIAECATANDSFRKRIDDDFMLMEQEKTAIESLMEKLNEINEIRKKRFANTSTNANFSTQLTETYENMKTNLKEGTSLATNHHEKRRRDEEEFKEDLSKRIKLAEVCIDKSNDAYSILRTDNFDNYKEGEEKLKILVENENEFVVKLENVKDDRRKEITNYHKQQENILSDACSTVAGEVEKYASETIEKLVRAESYSANLQADVDEYVEDHKKQMGHCSVDVEQFRRSELKTYASTGATPSKRDFTYPRILAATSPHSRIIKRVRQDNNWSDLDTTATIDEEESDEESHRDIVELSDSETVFNSTPINIPLEKANIVNITSGSKLLKPPNNKIDKNLPSPRDLSPKVNECDKENQSALA